MEMDGKYSNIANMLFSDHLSSTVGLQDSDIDKLQSELIQHPICEALKLDKKDPAEVVQESKYFADELRGNVSAAAWDNLNNCNDYHACS